MLRIYNKFFSGYVRESCIEAVWLEKERREAFATPGPWRVMIRAAGHDYLYGHYSGEHLACEVMEDISTQIDRAPGMEG